MVLLAFELDDTLIPSSPDMFDTEPPRNWWRRWFVQEHLRVGSNRLLSTLSGICELWVYTTSMRGSMYVRFLLGAYGGRIRGVVNGDRHMRWLKKQPRHLRCPQYPPAYDIDLIVDDSEGVAVEGRQLGYQVLLIRPDDLDWTSKILKAVGR